MSSLSIWNKIQRKETEKRNYENRKKQVTNINNSVDTVSESYVSVINTNIDILNSHLTSGIKGLSEVEELKQETSDNKEKPGIADFYLSNYDDELRYEVSDCQKKIDSLDTEIASLRRQYKAEVAKEREAARKALEKIREPNI